VNRFQPYLLRRKILLELEAIIIQAAEPSSNLQSANPMQTTTLEQLSPTDAQAILDRLPKRIRTALLDRATEIEYPIESRWLIQVFWEVS
jgi:hypothetical protein